MSNRTIKTIEDAGAAIRSLDDDVNRLKHAKASAAPTTVTGDSTPKSNISGIYTVASITSLIIKNGIIVGVK